MAFHETYQVYNAQNKQFVKMRNGQILECSYFQFEDVPLFGEPKQEAANEAPNTDAIREANPGPNKESRESDGQGSGESDGESGGEYSPVGVGMF